MKKHYTWGALDQHIVTLIVLSIATAMLIAYFF